MLFTGQGWTHGLLEIAFESLKIVMRILDMIFLFQNNKIFLNRMYTVETKFNVIFRSPYIRILIICVC